MLRWHYPIALVLPLLLLLFALALPCSEASAADEALLQLERPKRGTVTLDFGLLLRNLLQKSAQLSSAKVNITQSIINAKTTRRPAITTTTTTTTTTAAPPPAPTRPRRPRPYYGHGWRPSHPYPYYPYDYDADYGYAPRAPAPVAKPRRLRPLPRPLSDYYAQKPGLVANYDYDYDYDVPDNGGAGPRGRSYPQPVQPQPQPPPPPPPPPPPVQPQPQPQPQQPAPRRQRPRPRPPAQLADQLIYQYAQPDDIYSKPASYDDDAAAPLAATPETEDAGIDNADTANIYDNPSSINNNDNDLTDVNNPTDVDVDTANEDDAVNPPTAMRFLVNYPDDGSNVNTDYLAQRPPTVKYNPYDAQTSQGFNYFNSYASASPNGRQHSNYFIK